MSRFVPFVFGLGFIPAIIIGIIFESTLGERFLEVPLIFIGMAWVLIGYRLRAPGEFMASTRSTQQ